LSIGTPFYLKEQEPTQGATLRGTQEIMARIAEQLPFNYRGVYK
jgi:hypothetical protein